MAGKTYRCERCSRALLGTEVVTCDTCAILVLRDLLKDTKYLTLRGPEVERTLRRDLASIEAATVRPAFETREGQ